MWHDSFIYVTWLIHTCDMTHSYMWHDSFIYATWLIHTCDMTHSYMWHDSFIYVTWLIHICDMTHSYVWHDSFVCATWPIHMCDMTHWYVWHDSCVCVTWLMHMCIMTIKIDQNWSIVGWFFRGGPLPHGSWSGEIITRNPPRGGGFLSIRVCTCAGEYICKRTHAGNPFAQVYVIDMGWLRLVGSLKLLVSFEKQPYDSDDILQKRPVVLRSLRMVATQQIQLYVINRYNMINR